MTRFREYAAYHYLSYDLNDIDPSYPLLRYIADRYELNMEQRYWIAWLYALCYNGATTFYLYNEFPDFENVDLGRLERWWMQRGRQQSAFTSDRAWVRSRNQVVPAFQSYQWLIGNRTQQATFDGLLSSDPYKAYDRCYKYFSHMKYFGRFSLFLYLEAVHVVTGFAMKPTGINWKEATSSCNGLCYALGRDEWLHGEQYGGQLLSTGQYNLLDVEFGQLLRMLQALRPSARVDAWNVETTLCAFKKYHRGTRYPGFYLDRQAREIENMSYNVQEGVDWNVLWQFRRETYQTEFLAELGADNQKFAPHRLKEYEAKL